MIFHDFNGLYIYRVLEYCLENYGTPLDSQVNTGIDILYYIILCFSWTSVEGLVTSMTSLKTAGNVTLARSNLKFHSSTVLRDHWKDLDWQPDVLLGKIALGRWLGPTIYFISSLLFLTGLVSVLPLFSSTTGRLWDINWSYLINFGPLYRSAIALRLHLVYRGISMVYLIYKYGISSKARLHLATSLLDHDCGLRCVWKRRGDGGIPLKELFRGFNADSKIDDCIWMTHQLHSITFYCMIRNYLSWVIIISVSIR